MANALFDLPLTSGAFRSGELSYSKARALTCLATPETEQRLVDYAIPATAQQVDDYCRQLRNGQRELSAVDARWLHDQRSLSRSCHGEGSMTISIENTILLCSRHHRLLHEGRFVVKRDCDGEFRFRRTVGT